MHDREQKHAAGRRTGGMLYTGRHDEYVAGPHDVLAPQGAEDHFAALVFCQMVDEDITLKRAVHR